MYNRAEELENEPCGCFMCDRYVQPGHFACHLPSTSMFEKEEAGMVDRVYSDGRWVWVLSDKVDEWVSTMSNSINVSKSLAEVIMGSLGCDDNWAVYASSLRSDSPACVSQADPRGGIKPENMTYVATIKVVKDYLSSWSEDNGEPWDIYDVELFIDEYLLSEIEDSRNEEQNF